MSEGALVSRTVIVWIPLVVFPHWSVAVQSRLMSEVPPQLLLTESEKVTVTLPQPSWASAAPVLLVVVVAGQSRTTSGGRTKVGRIVSRTVINWVPLVVFPQASTAVQ